MHFALHHRLKTFKSFENISEKGENVTNWNFCFSHTVFLPIKIKFSHFVHIYRVQIWTSLKFGLGKDFTCCQCNQAHKFYDTCSVNPLPHMPILGSSNSAANKNMM